MKGYLLFYHRFLIQEGGAENVLISDIFSCSKYSKNRIGLSSLYLNNYIFKSSRIKCKINNIRFKGLFGRQISIILNFFIFFIEALKSDYILTSSGFPEAYIISFILSKKLILFDHHPISMMNSGRSLRANKSIQIKINNNFNDLNNYNLTPKNKKLMISLYDIFSNYFYLKALYFAKKIYVLSEFSKNEKQLFFGLETIIAEPAISFPTPKKMLNSFNKIKSNKDLKVVSISRLVDVKNIDKAIKAFVKSGLYRSGYKFFIYGTGPQEVKLKSLIQKYNNESSAIILKGFLSNKKIFNELIFSDIFISLEYADFNLSVIEAIYSGTKVITTKYTNTRSINTNNIIKLETLNINEISNSLIKLANSASLSIYEKEKIVTNYYNYFCKLSRFKRIYG